jgi:hypothetical protein
MYPTVDATAKTSDFFPRRNLDTIEIEIFCSGTQKIPKFLLTSSAPFRIMGKG